MLSLVRRNLRSVEGAWNPWRELRRRSHITFKLAPLPYELGAVYWPRHAGTLIVIDPSLSLIERNAALGHELIHDERGGGACAGVCPSLWGPVIARDEAAVETELAARMVPLGELDILVRSSADLGHSPDAWELADEFGVPERLIALAMNLLQRDSYGERWAG